MARVCVALSGGVDSAAAAILLQQKGHRVSGITMDTGHLSTGGAIRVAEHLGIPLRVVDLRREFEREVLRPTLESYQRLTTPNPCVWCNFRLKFGLLMEMALQDADLYATGHYACLSCEAGEIALKEAQAAGTQSQAYFLAMVPRERLAGALFPLCRVSRPEAEELVRQAGVPVGGSRSRDLCFLPEGGLGRLLKDRGVPNPPGRVVDTQGRVLGEHRGLYLYTLGQRRGVGAGGTSHRRYVVGRSINDLVVGLKEEATTTLVKVANPNWIAPPPIEGEALTLRLRYRQRGVEAKVLSLTSQLVLARLLVPAVAAPGQVAVFNRGDQVLGGGEILGD